MNFMKNSMCVGFLYSVIITIFSKKLSHSYFLIKSNILKLKKSRFSEVIKKFNWWIFLVKNFPQILKNPHHTKFYNPFLYNTCNFVFKYLSFCVQIFIILKNVKIYQIWITTPFFEWYRFKLVQISEISKFLQNFHWVLWKAQCT